MKLLLINPLVIESSPSRSLGPIDDAMTLAMYRRYHNLGICANHLFDKYTFIDEDNNIIVSRPTMDKLFHKIDITGTLVIMTWATWLDKVENEWRTVFKHAN